MKPTDYTKLTDTELVAARDNAYSAYYAAATHYDPDRDYSQPGQRFPELEAAMERLESLNREIERRYSCVHVEKIVEHVYGLHAYAKFLVDGTPDEIDVYYRDDGMKYRTTSDDNPIRRELLIAAYNSPSL